MAMNGRGDSQSSEPAFIHLKQVPPEIEPLLLKKDDIPGYELRTPPGHGIQHRTGPKQVGRSFYQERDKSGSKDISADIWHCDDLLTAAECAWTATITGTGFMPPGTMSNLPLGVDGSWWIGTMTEVEGKEVYASYHLVFWKDQVVCAVRFHKGGSLIAEPLSEREMHLEPIRKPVTLSGAKGLNGEILRSAQNDKGFSDRLLVENIARKILANKEGRQFTIAAAAPSMWKVMPVSLVAHDKETKKAGKTVAYEGQVYAAPDALTALGLTVKVETMPEKPKDKREAFKDFYLNKVKTVVVEKDKTNLKFEVGEKFYFVNGERTPLDTPARLVDGVPMVPLAVAAKALRMNFAWDAQRRVARVG
jgi:hypothetical protein